MNGENLQNSYLFICLLNASKDPIKYTNFNLVVLEIKDDWNNIKSNKLLIVNKGKYKFFQAQEKTN